MKKIIIILVLLMGVNSQADAQFLKKLGNAIDKAAQKVDKAVKNIDKAANSILGEPNSSNQSNKKSQKTDDTGQVTTQPQQTTQTAKSNQQTAPAQQTVKPTAATPQQDVDSNLVIKNRGIAGIRLGMKMSKVPKSVPGLYDGYTEDYGCDIGVFYCCKVTVPGEDNYLTISDNDENDIIDEFYVQVPGVRIAGTDIVIGMPFSDVINMPGVKKKADKYDPESFNYIYQGIYYLAPGMMDDSNIERLCSIGWGLNY